MVGKARYGSISEDSHWSIRRRTSSVHAIGTWERMAEHEDLANPRRSAEAATGPNSLQQVPSLPCVCETNNLQYMQFNFAMYAYENGDYCFPSTCLT